MEELVEWGAAAAADEGTGQTAAGERPVHVLIIEDDASDAALMELRLSRGGFDVRSHRVQDERGVRQALVAHEWDIILADHSLPGFHGLEALRLLEESGLDTPLILVSGAIEVPQALDAMKAGAKDFVFKDDMQRLPSIVEREVAAAARRREAREAEAARDLAVRQLAESHERLGALARFSDLPLQGVTAPELLHELLSRLITILPADGAAVLLLQGDKLVTEGAVGPHAIIGGEVTLGSGFAGIIAAEDRAMFIRDVQTKDLLGGHAIDGTRVRSLLGVPMHIGNRIAGVLRVEWTTVYEPPAWVLPLLEIAADRCALAIENARLYDREHSMAELLQQALLSAPVGPEGIEVGCFYESATEYTLVGGDFYDLFEVSPGLVALTIGDVSGKGLHAASVTALVKNALRAHIVDGDRPAVAMSKTNELVHRFTGPEMFVTAFVGLLHVSSGVLMYANAGHTPPAMVRPGSVELLEGRGALLGAFSGVQYDQWAATLSVDASLILYTDGLLEARGPANDFFGEDRLVSFLTSNCGCSPSELTSKIQAELRAFSGERLRDDVALLAVRASGLTEEQDITAGMSA